MEQIDWTATAKWMIGILVMAVTATVGAVRGLRKENAPEGQTRLVMGSIVEAGKFDAFTSALATQTAAIGVLTVAVSELTAIMRIEAKHEEEASIRADERRRLRAEMGLPVSKWEG